MHGCKNIVQILESFENKVALNAIRIDLVFEFCPFDLFKVIRNMRINFQIAEVKAILKGILCGLYAMHQKMVDLSRTTSFKQFCHILFFLSILLPDNAS